MFLAMCGAEDGVMSLEDLRLALLPTGMGAEEVATLFECMDYNGDNEVVFSEFLAAAADLAEERITCAFQMFDVDSRGRIDCEVVHSVLGEAASVVDVLPAGDSKRDWKISYDEFRAFLLRTDSRASLKSISSNSSGLGGENSNIEYDFICYCHVSHCLWQFFHLDVRIRFVGLFHERDPTFAFQPSTINAGGFSDCYVVHRFLCFAFSFPWL